MPHFTPIYLKYTGAPAGTRYIPASDSARGPIGLKCGAPEMLAWAVLGWISVFGRRMTQKRRSKTAFCRILARSRSSGRPEFSPSCAHYPRKPEQSPSSNRQETTVIALGPRGLSLG